MLRPLKNLAHFFLALLANVYYGFPSRRLTVIGVTGTDGKTTTSTLIYHILKTAAKKTALITSVSAKIGSKDIETGFHVTTPNPWLLQKLISQIASKGYQYLVLECTSHGLDQHRLLGINFHIGVLTNISHEHLDYHKTYPRYVKAKAKLFKRSNHAVINQDDNSYDNIKKLLSYHDTLHSYSLKEADKKLLACIKKAFTQKYNWSNALAASSTAQILSISPAKICQALKSFPGVKGRMESITNKKGITAIVDFAHTPNALKQVLASLQKTHKAKSKIIAVLGCAGLRDYAKRPIMGQIASELADIAIFTAEDPRTEDVNQIITQMKQGVKDSTNTYIEPERQKAIDLAIVKLAQKGDIVIVLGKGHEKSMCFGKIEYPWSDHEAIRQALKKRK